jgi:hypothetical protein
VLVERESSESSTGVSAHENLPKGHPSNGEENQGEGKSGARRAGPSSRECDMEVTEEAFNENTVKDAP